MDDGSIDIGYREIGECIYRSGDGIRVYCNREEGIITVSRSEAGIAESYFTYFLKEDRGIWLWVESESVNTQFGDRNGISDFGVVGLITKEKAKFFLVNRVVERWKKKNRFSFNVNKQELKTCLQKSFL